MRHLRVGKTERGWEIAYSIDGAEFSFAPLEESTVYPTQQEATLAAERELAEWRTWNRRGLADAPHLDAF